jgi:hypothetical protein
MCNYSDVVITEKMKVLSLGIIELKKKEGLGLKKDIDYNFFNNYLVENKYKFIDDAAFYNHVEEFFSKHVEFVRIDS